MGHPSQQRKTAKAQHAFKAVLTAPKLLEGQISVLELAVTIFQRAQMTLPLPEPWELAEMRSGTKPVSRAAYLLGFLQRSILALEEVATALRNEIEDTATDVQYSQLSEIDFNAIEAAVQEVRGFRGRREGEA